MLKISSVIAVTVLAFTGTICQAADPDCSTGSLAYLEGEINNNAVTFPGLLPVTLGVANLKLVTKKKKYKLTCALSGIPNESMDLDHNFDHRIVCNDSEQSELSLNTTFIGNNVLDLKLERKLCRGTVQSYFQEESFPDASEASKGLFRGVYEGKIFVEGCVNLGSDPAPDIQINMVVDGYVCLED